MSLFRGLLASATGAPRQSNGARLLDRLENSTQLEDRREALTEFNELSAAEPSRLIDKGMAVLVGLLREEDTQMTRDVLETLSNLMDPEVPRTVDSDAGQVKALHNASIFLTNEGHLLEVLNSSEDSDLYVRFHAVQVVMKLLACARRQTQADILNQPATIGRILSLAEDRREIVRNEVLLLLARLGEGNAGLQNIMAFQGAFEQLLGIIESESKEEGASSRAHALFDAGAPRPRAIHARAFFTCPAGGLSSVIVHDCLRIATSLLDGNASSSRFFRESGCLQRVPALLKLPMTHVKGHATTATLTCELVGCLLGASGDAPTSAKGSSEGDGAPPSGGGSASSESPLEAVPTPSEKLGEAWRSSAPPLEKPGDDIALTQASLLKLGLPPLLVALCTDAATATDPGLRLQALGTLAELTRGNPSGAAEVLAARITRRSGAETTSESALYRILYTGLRSSSAALRGTTIHLFRCLLHGNGIAQRAAAASLAKPLAAAPSAAPTPVAPDADGPTDKVFDEHSYASLALGTLISDGGSADRSAPAEGNTSASSVWVAGGVLAAVLYRNADVKRMLLRLPVSVSLASADDSSAARSSSTGDATAAAGVLLMPWVVRQALALMRTPSTSRPPLVVLSMLQLLLTWTAESVEATTAFASPLATLPSFLDAFLASGGHGDGNDVYDVHVRGHVAGLLGACLASGDSARDSASASAGGRHGVIVGMLKQRIGLEAYGDAWDGLVASMPMVAALGGATRWSSRKCEGLLVAGKAGLDGAVLYPPEMAALLSTLFTEAHAAVLDAHAQPAHHARGGAVDAAKSASAPTQQSVPIVTQATKTGEEGAIDPAIDSFKALIAEQDAKQSELRDELAQLREQHACVQAELESARATSVRADSSRQQVEELTEAREKAEAAARAANEELSRTSTELDGMAAAYAQIESALGERDAQLRSLAAGGSGGQMQAPEGMHGGGGTSSDSNAASVAVLQAHADGLARDKAALEAEVSELRASLAAVQAAGDVTTQVVRDGEVATAAALADANALQASLHEAQRKCSVAERERDEANEARGRAERGRDEAEAALEAAADEAAAQELTDAAGTRVGRECELEAALAAEHALVAKLRDEQEDMLVVVAEMDHELEWLRGTATRTPGPRANGDSEMFGWTA